MGLPAAGVVRTKWRIQCFVNTLGFSFAVLSDPQTRAIYDIYGKRGLEMEGWEVVERRRTPAEIREEFERLQREREESRLQQRTNPKGTISVGIDATDLFDRYEEEYEDVSGSGFPQIEINKMHISQSIVAPQQLQTQPSSLEASQPRMGMEGVPLTLRSDESLL